jgi:nitroreductase
MFLSGGAVAMNLVHAANALGYGTNWISNWYADDEEGRFILGLAPHERVIGFVHIGTFKGEAPDRPRPDSSTLYADYTGPWEKQRHVL